MKVGRDILLISIAAFIDALQAVLSWMAFTLGITLQSITPFGGAAAGAVAGGYACWNGAAGTLSALVAASKCALAGGAAGALASAFGIPIGVALGFVLEIIVSLTIGSGLILLLIFNGMYYSTRTPVGLIFEIMPGLDILPGWTVMTILCVLKKRAEEGKLLEKAATAFATMQLPDTALGAAVGRVKSIQRTNTNRMLQNGVATEGSYTQARVNSRQRINTELKSIDGITPSRVTPAEQNQPYVPKTA